MKRPFRYGRAIFTVASLIVLFIAEDCALPEIFGVVPSLLLPFTVAMGICEGPYMGAGFGVAAGMLMDFGGTAFGFSSLLLLVVGAASGLFTLYFRRTVLAAAFFTAVSAILFFGVKWVFLQYIWYGVQRLDVLILQAVFACVLSPAVFIPFRGLSKRFGDLKEAS